MYVVDQGFENNHNVTWQTDWSALMMAPIPRWEYLVYEYACHRFPVSK